MSSPRRVDIPAATAERIASRLPHTEFETVDQYVAYVLTAVLDELDEDVADRSDEVDEREVRDRLESLGYLES